MARVAVGLAVVVGLAIPAVWSALSSAPGIVFDIRVPPGVYPTIVTDTDASGYYKLQRISAHAYRLVNPDKRVAVRVIQDPTKFQPELGVENCGSNGPDPVPSIQVIFLSNGVAQSNTPNLPPGASTTCNSCDTAAVKIPAP